MPDTIMERVARGAALLDERRTGWAGEIDRGRLRIDSCAQCVLGQLYGLYEDGADELFHKPGCLLSHPLAQAEVYGFSAFDMFDAGEFASLEWAWLAAIAARLAPEPAWEPEPQEAELCPTT